MTSCWKHTLKIIRCKAKIILPKLQGSNLLETLDLFQLDGDIMSWSVMISTHDETPHFIIENHQESSKVTQNHHMSWKVIKLNAIEIEIAKNHDIRSTKIMKNVSFNMVIFGDYSWSIMTVIRMDFNVKRLSCMSLFRNFQCAHACIQYTVNQLNLACD